MMMKVVAFKPGLDYLSVKISETGGGELQPTPRPHPPEIFLISGRIILEASNEIAIHKKKTSHFTLHGKNLGHSRITKLLLSTLILAINLPTSFKVWRDCKWPVENSPLFFSDFDSDRLLFIYQRRHMFNSVVHVQLNCYSPSRKTRPAVYSGTGYTQLKVRPVFTCKIK